MSESLLPLATTGSGGSGPRPPSTTSEAPRWHRGFGLELFPSSMVFLKITSKEREALVSLPPLVSQPEKKGERRG